MVVPRDGESALCQLLPRGAAGYRDGERRLAVVRALPMPPLAPHVVVGAGTLVYGDGRDVHVLRGLGGAMDDLRLRLGWGFKVHALAERGGVVFIGGAGRREFLGICDLREPRPTFAPVPLPDEATRLGKGIDGFALHGDLLVAVDDILMPRYLLVYDIADPRAPRCLRCAPFPWSLTAEHVVAVASAGDLMAVLSTYANHGFMGVAVHLVELPSLRLRASLSAGQPGSIRRVEGPALDLSGVALVGRTLYLAGRKSGLGTLDLTPFLDERPAPKDPPRIPPEALRWTPFPDGPVEAVLTAGADVIPVVRGPTGLHGEPWRPDA